MYKYQVVKGPLVTEKANLQKEGYGQVSFKVHRKANKIEIRQAVETLLKAEVVDVKTMNVRGKRRRMGKHIGRRPDWKKAIIKLAAGQYIEGLEGM
ncbi:MAG: 50S ribosomal protein L23 [Thermodesulfobacteriota bacterium]|nr:50S ribosomal protein L23 [Thermodesulfobacteriota bacterium]